MHDLMSILLEFTSQTLSIMNFSSHSERENYFESLTLDTIGLIPKREFDLLVLRQLIEYDIALRRTKTG